MRRIVIVSAVVGVGFLIARAIAPKLREGLMTRCGAMFEHMPDHFPPKRMMRGIEETRVNTARIRELLESRKNEAHEPGLAEASSTEEVRHPA